MSTPSRRSKFWKLLEFGGGQARIYGPDGRSVAGQIDHLEEGMVCADIDCSLILAATNAWDPAATNA